MSKPLIQRGGDLVYKPLRQGLTSLWRAYKNTFKSFFKFKVHQISSQKVLKYQKNYEYNLRNLKAQKACVKFLFLNFKKCHLWLNSKEFKEKYLDTKHSLPPLLNPDTIDYKNTPALIGWDFNLPLPKNYDFIFISNGSSATAAMLEFLKQCKVDFKDRYGRDIYLAYFKSLKEGKACFFIYAVNIIYYQHSNRLINSLTSKTPLLYVARCPIEKLQHAINHIEALEERLIQNINLSLDYTKIFPKLNFWGGTKNPSFALLENIQKNHIVLEKLSFDTLIESLKDKISSICCIEFNDLKPDKAFDTFCKLADTLGFDKPTNKEIFINRVNRSRGALLSLPTTLYVHKYDLKYAFKEGQKEKRNLASLRKKGGFNIIITLPHYLDEKQKEFADISDEIKPNLIIDDTKICIIIDKNELIKLKENDELFKASKDYLKGYVNALRQNTQNIKSSYINEKQILEYLRVNDEARKNIKQILDTELAYIKTHHPDFIEKWKYYLEFEKMCEFD